MHKTVDPTPLAEIQLLCCIPRLCFAALTVIPWHAVSSSKSKKDMRTGFSMIKVFVYHAGNHSCLACVKPCLTKALSLASMLYIVTHLPASLMT